MELDRRIADALQKYPIIWDRSRKDFRANNKKENAYKSLASEVNSTVQPVMYRYKAIREKYRKEKLKVVEQTRSGAGAALDDSWELFNTLRFFDDVMHSRKRASDVTVPDSVPSGSGCFQNKSQVTADEFSEQNTEHILPELDEYEEQLISPFIESSMIEGENLEQTPLSSSSKRKRTTQDSDEDLKAMLATINKTAVALESAIVKPTMEQPSRFHWLGKYVAATLIEMQPEAANEKANALLQVLMEK